MHTYIASSRSKWNKRKIVFTSKRSGKKHGTPCSKHSTGKHIPCIVSACIYPAPRHIPSNSIGGYCIFPSVALLQKGSPGKSNTRMIRWERMTIATIGTLLANRIFQRIRRCHTRRTTTHKLPETLIILFDSRNNRTRRSRYEHRNIGRRLNCLARLRKKSATAA